MKKQYTGKGWFIVGMVANSLSLVSAVITYLGENPSLTTLIAAVVTFVACLVVFIFAMKTIKEGKKSVAIGVLGLLFVNLIGGIIHLCWNPNKK